MNFLLNKKRKS